MSTAQQYSTHALREKTAQQLQQRESLCTYLCNQYNSAEQQQRPKKGIQRQPRGQHYKLGLNHLEAFVKSTEVQKHRKEPAPRTSVDRGQIARNKETATW